MRRTPQEKKRLSYARDRRNYYGENDKSSRKNIPRSRARAHRANRHRARQVLAAAKGTPDTGTADAVEQRLRSRRPQVWTKWHDVALGEVVIDQLSARIDRGISEPERARRRIERVRRRHRRQVKSCWWCRGRGTQLVSRGGHEEYAPCRTCGGAGTV